MRTSALHCIVSLSIFGILGITLAPPTQAADRQANPPVEPATVHPSERTDGSVAEKVNDPTAYLRRLDLDTDFNWINYSDLSYKVTLGILTPLSERFRLRAAAPFYIDSPSDKGNVRLGDGFAGLTYIPFKTEQYSPFLGLRVDFAAGDAAKGAGLGVTQLTPTGGMVMYSLMKYGILIPQVFQYKQTVFKGDTKPKLSSFIMRPNLVFFPSRTAYARADWTITVDDQQTVAPPYACCSNSETVLPRSTKWLSAMNGTSGGRLTTRNQKLPWDALSR